MSEQTEKDIRQEEAEQAALEENAVAPEDIAAEQAAPEQVSDPLTQMAAEMQKAIEAGDFKIEAYLSQYKAALSDKEDLETKLLRLQADFDNFRRRSRQDNENAIYNANCATVLALLPVLDNLGRAVQGMKDGADKEGVVMIVRQFTAALQGIGLKEIEADGAEFDPNLHQSILQIEAGEEQKGKITMVLQKGYMLNDRLLRAAIVQVGI